MESASLSLAAAMAFLYLESFQVRETAKDNICNQNWIIRLNMRLVFYYFLIQ